MRLDTYTKVNIIAAYHFIVGGLYLVVAAGVLVVPTAAVALEASEFLARLPGWFLGVSLLAIASLIALIGGVNLVLGWGLWQLKPWGRLGAMIAAIFRIPVAPIGTIAGGVILYVLLQDQVREIFFAQSAYAPAPRQ